MITNMADYLDRAACLWGEKTAYSDSSESITFSDMRRRALILGSALARRGISGKTVPVYMPKGVAMASVFFGILFDGSSYCPLDTDMPAARLNNILGTLGSGVIITDEKRADKARSLGCGEVLVYEDLLGEEGDEKLIAEKRRGVIDTDPIYVLFTSGSTGTPKGVVQTHRALMDYVNWVTGRFEIGPDDVEGNQVEFFFDLSSQDIYAPVVSGCRTVFIDHDLFGSPEALMEELNREKISVILWVPSAVSMVANFDGMARVRPEYLRLVMACGEVMPCKQLNYWIKRVPGATYVNLYGPTETAVGSTYYVIDRAFDDGDTLPIGIPCENTGILLLDEEGLPVNDGDIGEICIRGSSLSPGYYKDPDKTAAAFISNPENTVFGERIYKTGDLGYYAPDGNLMFSGRKDFQIKHLGYRIELGEIETAAGSFEGIRECACVYDDKKKRIIMFYTGEEQQNQEFKTKLSEKLPHYMIPNRIIRLEEMPKNRNGKTDRTELKKKAGL